MCKTLVDVYGNNSVDIQGGEPTIYRHIVPLVQYCNEIGLKPTLISNGYALANREKCKQFKEAGVYDFLLSVHGLGERYDKIVGARARRPRAARHRQPVRAGHPVPVQHGALSGGAARPDGGGQAGVGRGARALNFIAFNPFVDQSLATSGAPRTCLATGSRGTPAAVIDYLDANDVEVNVSTSLLPVPERYRKFVQNFQQIVYDLHEWESAGEAWSGRHRSVRRRLPSVSRSTSSGTSKRFASARSHRNWAGCPPRSGGADRCGRPSTCSTRARRKRAVHSP